MLYAVTSTFTLAKVVRDRQEASTVANRVEQGPDRPPAGRERPDQVTGRLTVGQQAAA